MSLKDIRPALRAFLLADATISAAVGGERIYPGKMPQGETRDSVVYQEISSQGDHHNEGPSRLVYPRIQIAAWSNDVDAAHALHLAIKERLDGYKGVMGSGGAAVTVQGVFFDNSRDQDDDDAGLRGKVADYIIWYEER